MENWVIKNRKADFELVKNECGVSEVLARCLVNKGIETTDEMLAFLHPRLSTG